MAVMPRAVLNKAKSIEIEGFGNAKKDEESAEVVRESFHTDIKRK